MFHVKQWGHLETVSSFVLPNGRYLKPFLSFPLLKGKKRFQTSKERKGAFAAGFLGFAGARRSTGRCFRKLN